MLMTSSTATHGRGDKGEEGEGKRRDRMGEEKEKNQKIQTIATDHSRGGVPQSRSPRLTVIGDLKREKIRDRKM